MAERTGHRSAAADKSVLLASFRFWLVLFLFRLFMSDHLKASSNRLM